MIKLVISDLHMGDGTGRDDFGNHDDDILTLIRRSDPGEVVLAGDIYELWQCTMRNIRKAHKNLVTYIEDGINQGKIKYLRGNHDYKLGGRETMGVLLSNGKKVLIAHGHQNDRWMRSPVSKIFTFTLGVIERFIPGADNVFGTSRIISNNASKYAMGCLMEYDAVILGHTHIQESPGSQCTGYFNSGACVNGRIEGVIIDTDASTIKTFKYR